ncbi:MAG: type II toxin-antitoxin system RelE/ParE family toxin [Defluviitaleaceae bacterium]|nr:type II toxin-antitoxin system RelE/ParE family toxin [Defluviitaleaceae bacterium]
MYNVIFYSDNRGREPIIEFIDDLRQRACADKNARINLNKIVAYIDLLCQRGTQIGEPFVKHLGGDIWELRPLNNRILFSHHKGKIYILLHHFAKKTNKTPLKEIKQASRNLADYIERNDK